MNRSRHQNSNSFRSNHMALLVVTIAILAFWGLGLVTAKNTMHALGKKRKELETRLRVLQEDNDTLRTEIAAQSSPRMLEQKMKAGFIQLASISSDRIVRLKSDTQESNREGLRAVSNEAGLR